MILQSSEMQIRCRRLNVMRVEWLGVRDSQAEGEILKKPSGPDDAG